MVVGKRVLLPVGFVQLDYEKKSIYTPQLTKEQIESLPDLAGELGTDTSYEERISSVYGSLMPTASPTHRTEHSSTNTGLYDRYPTIYGTTGSFRDYENELISQYCDECKT